MASGEIKKVTPTVTSNSNGKILKINNLIVQQTIEKTVNLKTQTTFTFPTTFPNKCLFAIPICTQLGFGRPSVINSSFTTSSATVFQNNKASASMRITVVAFGY